MVLLKSLALSKGDRVATELVQGGLGRLIYPQPLPYLYGNGELLGGCSSTHLKNEVYY